MEVHFDIILKENENLDLKLALEKIVKKNHQMNVKVMAFEPNWTVDCGTWIEIVVKAEVVQLEEESFELIVCIDVVMKEHYSEHFLQKFVAELFVVIVGYFLINLFVMLEGN